MNATAATPAALTPATVQVGQAVTHTLWTDSNVYHVVEVQKNGRTLVLREAKATLLNGANSGEADALHFSPGGFCGHTSGVQRWDVQPDPNGRLMVATWRAKAGRYKMRGDRTNSPGGSIHPGAYPHYDFNF